MLNTRSNASSLYKYGVTVCDKTNCLILAPDDFTGTIEASYDAIAWASAEDDGLVCLPAAGWRDADGVGGVGGYGFYRSSTAYDEDWAYHAYFHSNYVSPASYDEAPRSDGYSVRLITDVK